MQTLSPAELKSHTLTEKIDEIIETNTKSIVGHITGGQLENYNKVFNRSQTQVQSSTWIGGMPAANNFNFSGGITPEVSEVDLQNMASFKGVPQFSQGNHFDVNQKVIEFEFSEAASRAQF